MSFDVILPFLKPIEDLLVDERTSEIMINPDGSIWREEEGETLAVPGVRFDEGALRAGLEVIAHRFHKKLDRNSPLLNLRLPDGSRLAAMIPPVVHPEPAVTIRKFTSRSFTIDDLIARHMLEENTAVLLRDQVRGGANILVAGGTGTGKTTLVNVMADFIPDEERILVIEDTAELYFRKPHVIQTESQTDTHRDPVTFDALLKAVLRHRPDRIIVGEVRGIEARTLLDAMNTGHRGTLATIHANGAPEAIHRLAHLALRATDGLGFDHVLKEVLRSIDVVVYVVRRDGRRTIETVLGRDQIRKFQDSASLTDF